MNKNKVLMSLVAALLATSAFAIPKSSSDNNKCIDICEEEAKCCAEEIKPGPFAFSYAKDLGLACPSDFYVFGEYLLMEAKMEGLEYTMTQTNTTNDNGSNFPLASGQIKTIGHNDWDFNHGFRIGAGTYLNHDSWNLEAKWTYLHIKQGSSASLQNDGVMVPFWIPPAVSLNATNKHASAKWKAKFNTLDLVLGKPYHVSRYFIANPYFGLRGAWIDQDILFRYSGTLGTTDGTQVDATHDYWGIGLRGGMGAEYLLGRGWNLFGDLSASLLYGKFNISQNLALGNYAYSIDHDFYNNIANMELMVGFAWGTFFNRCRSHFTLKVGYEFHEWFNQNQLRRFFGDGDSEAEAEASTGRVAATDTVSRGNLALNGFSFRLQFDF